MFEQNLVNIKKRFPDVHSILQKGQIPLTLNRIKVIDSKNGLPTLIYCADGKELSIHSRYNPSDEAERFIVQLGNLDEKHVIFYGLGLGYHIEAFRKRYPELNYSIYEPSMEVLGSFLSNRPWDIVDGQNLKDFYVQVSEGSITLFLKRVLQLLQEEYQIVVLPSYEIAFKKECNKFFDTFRMAIRELRVNYRTMLKHQDLWIMNSTANLVTSLSTPNIIQDVDVNYFLNRPAIIVAAGPSLNEEIENLRYIKENKLAYLFSVGSAINTLIDHNIIPDAVCAFDANKLNQKVYKKLIDRDKESVPMVFGSWVNYEMLQQYKGPKLHMLFSRDTVIDYFLKRKDNVSLRYLIEAPSIAMITFQVLARLGCSPIILVGQNLGYKNNLKYSSGITYLNQSLDPDEIENAIEVDDVYGNKMSTSVGHNMMRKDLEQLIALVGIEVINTTKGGARIEGSTFIPLEDVIENRLTKPVTDDGWLKALQNEAPYDMDYAQEKAEIINGEFMRMEPLMREIRKGLEKIKTLSDSRKDLQLAKEIDRLILKIKDLTTSNFYLVFLLPMVRIQTELLLTQVEKSKKEKNLFIKAEQLYDEISSYLEKVTTAQESITPLYVEMHEKLTNKVER